MPYEAKQAQACYAKANACVSAGYQPGWSCDTWFDEIWDLSGEKNKIQSGGYTDTCGGPLKSGEPTTVYQARKLATAQGLRHKDGEKVTNIKVA